MPLIQFCLLLVLAWLPLTATATATAAVSATAKTLTDEDYIGAQTCGSCHPAELAAWQDSDHSWSMREASEASVKGDFDESRFDYFGQVSRFYRDGERFMVETQDGRGEQAHFQIRYTFGVYPLQQYLIGFDDGRYQILNIAWDSRPEAEGGQRWFHLHPDKPIRYDSPLHWSGPYQRWNSRCAHCHSTNLKKNFDPTREQYQTQWSELNVACEACHGPGKSHLQWAQGKTDGEAAKTLGLSRWLQSGNNWQRADGLATAVNQGQRNPQQLESCAGCHSRRQLLSEGQPGHQLLGDGHRLRLPHTPLYHPDGQIDDEVFVYGSFLQSKMHQRGVVCSDCHDPHSLKLKADGNQLCAQCHNPQRFDQPEHHRHAANSSGSQCVSCHMPATTYMQVDPRRDHSLRIPRPDLSVSAGTPNACNQCHDDRSAQWAVDALGRWQKEKGVAVTHSVADQLLALNQSQGDHLKQVEKLQQSHAAAIVRATALTSLAAQPSAEALSLLQQQYSDNDPLVREAALQGLSGYPLRYRAALAVEALSDPVLSVRLQAFQLIIPMGASAIPAVSRDAYRAAEQQYRDWLRLQADTPDGQLRLGNFFGERRQPGQAIAHYRKALEYNPQLVAARVNLAQLQSQQGEQQAAVTLLQQGIKLTPEAAALHHSLGLASVRVKNYRLAARQLNKAWQLEPENARYGYVAAVAMEAGGDLKGAIDLLARLNLKFPSDREIAQALRAYRRKAGH